jgi:hypothetical protein
MLPRSILGITKTEIEFINRTRLTVEIYWVDYQGELKLSNTIRSGDSCILDTCETHPWIFRDKESGRELFCTIATSERQTLELEDDRVNLELHNEHVKTIAHLLSQGDISEAEIIWRDFIASLRSEEIPVDINGLVLEVMRESYMETTNDLAFHAQKVKFFNECKKMIHSYIRQLRAIVSKQVGSAKDVELLSAYEDELRMINEDEQLASIDFQNILQKQQQVVQMWTDVSKSLRESAQTILQNSGL